MMSVLRCYVCEAELGANPRQHAGHLLCEPHYQAARSGEAVVPARGANAPSYVCVRCGSTELPTTQAPSLAFGVVLLFFFIIPGVLYFVWRAGKVTAACSACGSQDIIPADSPRAKALLSETRHAGR